MTETTLFFLGAAFLIMILVGYFSTVLICSDGLSNTMAWTMAPAVGMGLCSIIFFIARRPMFTVEFLLLIVTFGLWLRYRRKTMAQIMSAENRIPLVAVWMVAALAWVTLASVIWIQRAPYGGWDGWAIWGSHARYLYRAGPVWQQHIRNTAHPDYPLLLPAATARLWRYTGKEVPEAPGVQALLIAISGVLVLTTTLWELRSRAVSFLIPLLLIATPSYMSLAVWQYADVPFSVYILSTIGLICISWERDDNSRLLTLAGFTAGCAAWTKNEGLLFVLSTVVMILLPVFRHPAKTMHRAAMFLLGLFLPLAVTSYYKWTVASTTDIFINRTYNEVLMKILDINRYFTIAMASLRTAGSFGGWAIHPVIPLVLLLMATGVNKSSLRKGGWLSATGVFVLMAVGYFALYIITSARLEVHLTTSLDRLMIHLWPTALLLVGLVLKD